MKILYLCADGGIPVLGRKGASVHVREMVAAFSRAGHQVVLAAPVLNKSPWEKPAEIPARVLHLPVGNAGLAAVQAVKSFQARLGFGGGLPGELRRILGNEELATELLRRFEADPPDFIYERAALYGTAGAAVASALRIPLLLEVNAPLAVEQSAYRGNGLGDLGAQAERWSLARADVVLAVSRCLVDHVTALGIDAGRVQVLPNGVNPGLFCPASPDPALRGRLALADGPVLGFVGGLRPWHGIEALPELLARLAPKHPGLQLLIVGEGPLRADLEQALRGRNLRQRASFVGAVPHDQVPALIRLFDVALAPYPVLQHDFYFSPLKVFEYMACGAAVLAADCGQIAEVIQDGTTGLLHSAGDLEALTSACDRLLEQPKLRLALGQAAAAHVRQHFTWDRNAERAVALARAAAQTKLACS